MVTPCGDRASVDQRWPDRHCIANGRSSARKVSPPMAGTCPLAKCPTRPCPLIAPRYAWAIMIEAPDPTTPGARFPWAAAAFACACVATAAWTYMLFSYAWPISLRDLGRRRMPARGLARHEAMHPMLDRYVVVTGILVKRPLEATMMFPPSGWLLRLGDRHPKHQISGFSRVCHLRGVSTKVGTPMEIRGRLAVHESWSSIPTVSLYVDATRSRWTGASVAGLVVGAMGVFIFALHLRRWLRVRRLGGDAG